jgi:hypothetical protein
MSLIICGSRKYNVAPLDRLVDSFDKVVRNNMLLDNDGYGTKEADVQIMNCHVYNHYITEASYERWEQTYLAEHGMDPAHLERFYQFILNANNTEFIYFDNNNTSLLNEILSKNNIDITFTKQLRCGLAGASHFIDLGEKPFLIGFSITGEQDKSHVYNLLQPSVSTCHDPNLEHEIIKSLHEAGIVDASLCSLSDTFPFEFDGVLQPTEQCVKLVERFNSQ